MMPLLHPSDTVVVVDNHTSFNSLNVGDIIVFRSPGVREDRGQPEVIVHRVAKIYTTYQGESNNH
jgi:signal peptidase I